MTHAIKYTTEMLDRNDRPYYTRDSATTDAQALRNALDAVRKGRRGAVVVVDENGEVEVSPLGGAEVIVNSEAFNASFGPIVSLPPDTEHLKHTDKFPPVVQLGVGDKAAADAAKLEAARKDRQMKLTADAKRFNQESFARNERIARECKAISDKQWPVGSNKGFSRGR